MGREFELKYTATEAVLADLAKKYPGGRKISMETTYFDTQDGSLSSQKMTLRIRKENGTSVCTLKTPLPDGSRGEWECQASDIREGISILLKMGAPAKLAQLSEGGLAALCGARFVRQAIDVPTIDGIAELALDSGVLLGDSKELPLCEVEVELKSGSDAATTAFAALLAATYGLKEQPLSKFRRASALAKGE